MNLETVLIGAIVGAAAGWLVRRWLSAARRRKAGGCAGAGGCAAQIQPTK